MKETKNNWTPHCPRQLDSPPCSSCPLALEKLNAVRADALDKRRTESNTGCPWYIASQEHHYCFWIYAETLEETVSDKEICALLGISQSVLEKTFASAVEKLKQIKDTEEIQVLREMIAEKLASQPHDYTTFIPDEFREALKKVSNTSENGAIMDEAGKEEEAKPRKHPTGLPLHRDGRKVDLFGLYSRKNKGRQRNRPPIKKRDDDK